jgi:hypothetical protein
MSGVAPPKRYASPPKGVTTPNYGCPLKSDCGSRPLATVFRHLVTIRSASGASPRPRPPSRPTAATRGRRAAGRWSRHRRPARPKVQGCPRSNLEFFRCPDLPAGRQAAGVRAAAGLVHSERLAGVLAASSRRPAALPVSLASPSLTWNSRLVSAGVVPLRRWYSSRVGGLPMERVSSSMTTGFLRYARREAEGDGGPTCRHPQDRP